MRYDSSGRTFVVAYPRAAFWSFIMAHDARFGPSAQTPAQRAWVLEQLQAALPSLKTKAMAYARQPYARYVAGELTWADVRQVLNAA